MDSMNVGSFHNTSSNTTGGNLWRNENYTKNYYSSSYVPKASQHKRKIHKEHKLLMFRQPSLKRLFKSTERESIYQECNRKYVGRAASEPSFESDPRAYNPKNNFESIKKFLDAFLSFCTCYPHAVFCSVLSITSASFLAVEKLSDISPLFFNGILQAVVANLLMAIYVNGLNQLCDIEIDKINKPYLPLASGKISFATGVTISVSFLILSFWQGWAVGSWPLICGLISFFALWTAYSVNVPLLRWKRNPVLAAMVVLGAWAFTYPLAFFFHIQTFVFKRPAAFSRPLIFVTIFMTFFSLSMAFFKDIPDIEGDQAFGIQSFSARLGQKKVFWICISLFEMAYGAGIFAGVTSSFLWSKIVTVLGHAVFASVLLYRTRSVDLKSKASITSFYMFIWKLLCVEYLLMPLVR